jgi:hypothetical protein
MADELTQRQVKLIPIPEQKLRCRETFTEVQFCTTPATLGAAHRADAGALRR